MYLHSPSKALEQWCQFLYLFFCIYKMLQQLLVFWLLFFWDPVILLYNLADMIKCLKLQHYGVCYTTMLLIMEVTETRAWKWIESIHIADQASIW